MYEQKIAFNWTPHGVFPVRVVGDGGLLFTSLQPVQIAALLSVLLACTFVKTGRHIRFLATAVPLYFDNDKRTMKGIVVNTCESRSEGLQRKGEISKPGVNELR